uniref:F-box/kelch-repeat protein At3g23880-like n=1 Tax=Erigeron canadensis TaxID=72917 RepID=UPI001CB89E94|nr:F-box/kelch-repeat protein At3g23880-like [Erigeron canadensis]
MSDNIPFEIQMEILERIPDVKSLIQFRSVSKAWKSMIDSKDFITAHTLRRHTTPHHLLFLKTADCCKVCIEDCEFNKVNKIDDDSIILGSSHGLFCLYEPEVNTVVIWNPSIRKTVATKIPNLRVDKCYETVVGFGVCPRNLDPKIVKITYPSVVLITNENFSTQVEVFTGGTWRIPLSSNLPHESISFHRSWAGYQAAPAPSLSLTNLRESLAVLKLDIYSQNTCDVWMMIGHGCTRSFNKLYSINTVAHMLRTLGFRKNGALIIELENDNEDNWNAPVALAMYEPESKSINNIGIYGLYDAFFVHSYVETLLLLDHRADNR